ncbi:hypothetical protein EDB19DRAFT_1903673 [Suillus lakei]|nr:hypothetical protein EDB19DRAFT_1903673 [Suillus lakei]
MEVLRGKGEWYNVHWFQQKQYWSTGGSGGSKDWNRGRLEYDRTLLDRLLQTFPWWVDLHGWWRTNPAYNTSFSTADPGQDFEAEAMDVFGKGKGKETVLDGADCEDDEGEDVGPLNGDLEPGEILDGEASKDDDAPARVDDSRLFMFHGDEDLGWDSPSDTSGSPSLCFPCPPLPQALSSGSSPHFQPSDLPIIHCYQCLPITHLNTSVSPLEPNDERDLVHQGPGAENHN